MISASRLAPGTRLPEHRVRARNLFRHAPNPIHDDTVARGYGYAAGLVAGTTVYGYLSHPLVSTFGRDWLARGTAQLRLVRPVYEGDEIHVSSEVVGRSGGPVAGEVVLEVAARTAREGTVATAVAGLAWGGPLVVPDPEAYPVAPLPAELAPADPAVVARLDPLGSPVLLLDAAVVARYVEELEDPLDVYQGPGAGAPPGLLLQQANRALAENVALGPWIHVSSDLAHCGLARVGDRLTTRGRVTAVSERKGRRYVDLDVLVVAERAGPVLHVRHTAIYTIPEAS